MLLKLSNPYFNPLVTLLLIIIIILIMFCIMSKFLYKSQHIQFDYENDYDSDYKIKQYILSINKILDDNRQKNQESFGNITVDDVQGNIDNLNLLSQSIDKLVSGDLQNIKNTIDELKKTRLEAKDKILNMLTNIYIIRYIDFIKQGNAVSYQQYLAYQNPNTNKYYKQYQ